MIWSTILKSTIFCTVPKLINKVFPTLEEYADSATESVKEFFTFEDSSEQSNTNSKGATKKRRDALTEQQYIVIMTSFEVNYNAPNRDKLTQEELTKKLNEELGLHFTRSGYCHLWWKRIVPTFDEQGNRTYARKKD